MVDKTKSVNLGGYHENDFKESNSIAIASQIIEWGQRCKTHFQKEDKTPNIDGRISILLGSFEFQIVEAQVKALPEDVDTTKPFKFSCDTKIINFARFRVSANPVVLLVVDVKRIKVFFKLLTHDYVEFLNIGDQETKTILFDHNDEYSDEAFIKQALRMVKVTNTNTACVVHCGDIRRIIRNANRTNYRLVRERSDNDVGYDEHMVYQRGNVTGYLAAFRCKCEGKRRYKRNGIIKMLYHKKVECSNQKISDADEYAMAIIRFEKGYVNITRQPSEGYNITDADFGNIVLEIAKEVDKEGLPVLFFHYTPVYWFHGVQMYQMKSEHIYLPWDMRL